jgi:predicted alpha/beta-hydrolase family hydrolase
MGQSWNKEWNEFMKNSLTNPANNTSVKPKPALSKGTRGTSVTINTDEVDLEGDLDLPEGANGVVIFAHGSGSGRHSPRNQYVANHFREAGLGTLLFDLLTEREEREDAITGRLRFDIDLLASRLVAVTRWLDKQAWIGNQKVGYFGASTGAAAALIASVELGGRISSIVSRGGRPDLAGEALGLVRSPTLLIVGGLDSMVICLNEDAYARLRCEKSFRVVTGATHLFGEPGKLEQVARLSTEWFSRYMGGIATGRN